MSNFQLNSAIPSEKDFAQLTDKITASVTHCHDLERSLVEANAKIALMTDGVTTPKRVCSPTPQETERRGKEHRERLRITSETKTIRVILAAKSHAVVEKRREVDQLKAKLAGMAGKSPAADAGNKTLYQYFAVVRKDEGQQ